MTLKTKIQVICNSVTSAIEAQKGGASSIQLIDNAYEGGTTPSYGAIATVRKNISTKLDVLIRPRGGDFCYNDIEFESIKVDIKLCKDTGVDGVSFGVLNPAGTIDTERCAELTALAKPMTVTFNRAFDMVENQTESLKTLIELGFSKVLTSGKENKAIYGVKRLQRLVEQANGRILVVPSGNIGEKGITVFAQVTGASEIQIAIQKRIDSQMKYRNQNVFLSGIPDIPEYQIAMSDADKISEIADKLFEQKS